MDAEKFWSTTEMNKFLYQQLKAMCEVNGFVLSLRKGHYAHPGGSNNPVKEKRTSLVDIREKGV